MGNRHICPDCAKCVGLCSFSANLTPVRGWTAERVAVTVGVGKRAYTYRVTACPLFERDGRAAAESANAEKWTDAEDATLLSAVNCHLKLRTIAGALNRSENAVKARLHKLRTSKTTQITHKE